MDNPNFQKYLAEFIEKTRQGTGDSDRHILPLFSLALASHGKTFLELGVRGGTTTLPLLLAAHLNGGKLYSVDLNDSEFKCPPELAGNWKIIKGDALEFLRKWDQSLKIDFVFIDDWHTGPHVRKELEYLRRCTTPKSIITLHDLMYGGFEPRYHTNPAMWKGEWAKGGPFAAVNELGLDEWEWSTLPWHSGLTILRQKASTFSESRLKIWTKRLLQLFGRDFERRLSEKYHAKFHGR